MRIILIATYKQPRMKMLSARKRILTSVIVFSALFLQISGVASAAGSIAYTLSPAGGSYAQNSTLSVTIHENSGSTNVNAIEADLNYDSSKLQFLSIDSSASGFDQGLVATGGAGLVKISRYKLVTNLTGDQTIGVVSFKVLAGTGSSSITFADTSMIAEPLPGPNPPLSQDIWNHVATGGTYTFSGGSTTPPPPPPPPPSPSPNPSPSPSPSPSGSPKTTTTTTKTNPTNSTVSTSQPTKTYTNPEGYYVGIRVVDAFGKPVQNADVTINGQKPLTFDKDGLASFNNITAGPHTVIASVKGVSATQQIVVSSDSPATTAQVFTVKMNTITGSSSKALLYLGGFVLLIVLTAGAVGLFGSMAKKRREAKFYADRHVEMKTVEQPTVGAIPNQEGAPTGAIVGSFDGSSSKKSNQSKS